MTARRNTQANDGIVWKEPPPAVSGGARKNPQRQAMDANPGRWLLYSHGTKSNVLTYLKLLGYEATTRKNQDGTVDIYARKPAEG